MKKYIIKKYDCCFPTHEELYINKNKIKKEA